MTALVEAVVVRDPDGPTDAWVFVDVAPVDAGAGWDWEDWCEHWDEMLAGASAAVRELLLEVLDGPPGGGLCGGP